MPVFTHVERETSERCVVVMGCLAAEAFYILVLAVLLECSEKGGMTLLRPFYLGWVDIYLLASLHIHQSG